MRILQIALRVIAYAALWVVIIVACTVLAALTSTIGIPDSWDGPGQGIGMLVYGWWGFFIGTGVATVIVAFVIGHRARGPRNPACGDAPAKHFVGADA
jgi:hypothetical protein